MSREEGSRKRAGGRAEGTGEGEKRVRREGEDTRQETGQTSGGGQGGEGQQVGGGGRGILGTLGMGRVRNVQGRGDPLSNFFEEPVMFRGRGYKTAEGAYQATKLGYHGVGDRELSKLAGWVGGKAKAYADDFMRGRELQRGWEEAKEGVMVELLRARVKGCQFRRALMATGGMLIVHGVPNEFWGIGGGGGSGENVFGRCLMQVREEERAKGANQGGQQPVTNTSTRGSGEKVQEQGVGETGKGGKRGAGGVKGGRGTGAQGRESKGEKGKEVGAEVGAEVRKGDQGGERVMEREEAQGKAGRVEVVLGQVKGGRGDFEQQGDGREGGPVREVIQGKGGRTEVALGQVEVGRGNLEQQRVREEGGVGRGLKVPREREEGGKGTEGGAVPGKGELQQETLRRDSRPAAGKDTGSAGTGGPGEGGASKVKQGRTREVVVIGDSMVKGWEMGQGVRAMLPRGWRAAVTGQGGLRSTGLGEHALGMVEAGREVIRERGGTGKLTDIILHVGTNDGGDRGNLNVELVKNNIVRAGEAIREAFGEVKMWWSEILPRPRSSRQAQADMGRATRELGGQLRALGWGVITHPRFSARGGVRREFFWEDGLHLDRGLGLEYFARELAEGLQGLQGGD